MIQSICKFFIPLYFDLVVSQRCHLFCGSGGTLVVVPHFIVPLCLFFMFKSNKYHCADHPIRTLGVEKQIKIEFGH